MPGVEDTAYPRLKKRVKRQELERIYTPILDEIKFARKKTRSQKAVLCFLIMLKTFQRLGYFIQISTVPPIIVQYIAENLQIKVPQKLADYDYSKTRYRHLAWIRKYLDVTAFGEKSITIIETTIQEAALVKEDLVDIINVTIEELVRQRHELPAFSTLRRIAFNNRKKVNNQIYHQITQHLTPNDHKRLNSLFVVAENQLKSPWQSIKSEAKNLTLKNLKQHIEYVQWLNKYNIGICVFPHIAKIKIKQFAAEAKSMNAPQMARLKVYKRYALAIALLTVQKAVALDDLGEMLIKLVNKIHRNGHKALSEKNEQNQERTDKLIETFHQILCVYQQHENNVDRDSAIDSIIGDDKDTLIKNCEEHALYAGKNYFPFLWRFHASNRGALFEVLYSVDLICTTQKDHLIKAIEFIKRHRKSKKMLIEIDQNSPVNVLSASLWMAERWQKVVFNSSLKNGGSVKVHRQYFELCVFYYLMRGLKSGDICINGSDKFSDYRKQLISWAEYNLMIGQYGEQVGLPLQSISFLRHLHMWLANVSKQADNSFPINEDLGIEGGKPILKKDRLKQPRVSDHLEALIAERIKPVTILDVLAFCQQWLSWDKSFGPLSGYNSKLDNPSKHHIITTFCYGCNLGPMQTARSVKGLSRFQIARINQRHVTEEKLNEAIVKIINAYNLFDLPKIWGSGKSASVDGTLWDTYEENLFTEYHIRYGGYGGIGYYHISDQYIALFSHFIPCGVHEAIYIIDGLLKNKSDIQPEIIHGDTHAQSEMVFGLSYLLGIKLMPRIRNWKHLTFYKPDKKTIFKHIEELFSDRIDWELIENYLPDMLRVALSIKAGRITASSILRKLGTYSRKNKLYQAFRELGRVVRTAFLLEYLNDKELRDIIQAATCKSETFNKFAHWLLFGDEGIIKENNRDEQRKIIKYNHLVANCVSLYNVVSLTQIINNLIKEGYPVHRSMVAALSPYVTSHINRFGDYRLDLDFEIHEIVHDIHLPEFAN